MISLVALLSGLGFAAGVVALVVYALVLARQPEWVRLLNGSGLFLTGLALLPSPNILAWTARTPAAFSAQASVALLILAVLVQSAASLRNRRAWDGVDRRSSLELEARS